MMNKYQKALDELSYPHEDSSCGGCKCGVSDCQDCKKALAVYKLEELVEKATPKKPISKYIVDGRYCVCPECGALLDEECLLKTHECLREGHQYCHVCGQAIDWSEEDGSSD